MKVKASADKTNSIKYPSELYDLLREYSDHRKRTVVRLVKFEDGTKKFVHEFLDRLKDIIYDHNLVLHCRKCVHYGKRYDRYGSGCYDYINLDFNPLRIDVKSCRSRICTNFDLESNLSQNFQLF